MVDKRPFGKYPFQSFVQAFCQFRLILITSPSHLTLNHGRPYWRCYYANTAAIIYVIDASDTERLNTAKAELLAMLSEEELKDSKLLVFANKQDLPGALDEGQVSEKLGLSELKDRQWSIYKCCATKGEGLEDGLDW